MQHKHQACNTSTRRASQHKPCESGPVPNTKPLHVRQLTCSSRNCCRGATAQIKGHIAGAQSQTIRSKPFAVHVRPARWQSRRVRAYSLRDSVRFQIKIPVAFSSLWASQQCPPSAHRQREVRLRAQGCCTDTAQQRSCLVLVLHAWLRTHIHKVSKIA